MNRFIPFISIGLLSVLFFQTGCDQVDAPFTQNGGGGGGGGGDVKRTILVEEFTGFKCKNCPDASKALHNLKKNTYNDQLVIVAVHAGTLAQPNIAGNYSSADYRTTEGTQLAADFLIDFVPVALINRVPDVGSSTPFYSKEIWASVIAAELEKPAEAEVELSATYNASNRNVSITVDGKFLTEGTDQEYLSVYVIEDGVVGEQDSNGVHIEHYDHKSMFRGSVNGLYGDRISTTVVPLDYTFTKNYTYTLPSVIDPAKCHIVAFIHRKDVGISTVRQADEVILLP
ncbi:MAG: Omp28 family outer membrane lipoprotein [Bacteroidia bacterium]|nr:Omp28 family outer membrane lipoprotein [Bacteroidia bacterium]